MTATIRQAFSLEKGTFVQIWRSIFTATIMVGMVMLSGLSIWWVALDFLVTRPKVISMLYALETYDKINKCLLAIFVNYLASPVIFVIRIPEVRYEISRVINMAKCN